MEPVAKKIKSLSNKQFKPSFRYVIAPEPSGLRRLKVIGSQPQAFGFKVKNAAEIIYISLISREYYERKKN